MHQIAHGDSQRIQNMTPPGTNTVRKAPAPPAPAKPASRSTSRSSSARTEETVNYEITKTVETHVREAGTVKRLSVAVLVDGTYTTAGDGTVTYEPRTAEELEQVAKLVRSAVGFDEARGDSVEVVNMQFVESELEIADPDALPFGLEKADLIRIAEMLVLGVVAILVMLLVVRPLVGRLLEIAESGTGQDPLADHVELARVQVGAVADQCRRRVLAHLGPHVAGEPVDGPGDGCCLVEVHLSAGDGLTQRGGGGVDGRGEADQAAGGGHRDAVPVTQPDPGGGGTVGPAQCAGVDLPHRGQPGRLHLHREALEFVEQGHQLVGGQRPRACLQNRQLVVPHANDSRTGVRTALCGKPPNQT